jgi:hypothetical protein
LADTIPPSVKIGLNDADDNVRGGAQLALGEVARARPELGETALELARKGALDARGTNTRDGAMHAPTGIVAARPDLGEQVLELAKKVQRILIRVSVLRRWRRSQELFRHGPIWVREFWILQNKARLIQTRAYVLWHKIRLGT